MTILRKLINNRSFWLYSIAIAFIIINSIFLVKENYYFMLLPFAVAIVLLAVVSLDTLLLAIVFLTPLSISLASVLHIDVIDMQLPSEPLLFGVMLIFFIKVLVEGRFDKRVAYHPVSIAIYFNLLWMLVTTVTSSMPLVSVKFLASRLWFVSTFYFFATQIFRNYSNIKKYIWLYTIPLVAIIVYASVQHISIGMFDFKVANWVMHPFYKDHTIYGAVVAMFVPVTFGFFLKGKYDFNLRALVLFSFGVVCLGLFLSYSRAAWLSVVGALGIWVIVLLKIRFRTIAFLFVTMLIAFLLFSTQIFNILQKNDQDSSADVGEHITSMTNVSTDASNLERLNRWACAFRMFEEKPVLGWGPGTYMFQYAPFQKASERTIISTNSGDVGNAHSEYIGPLAESGVLGSLSFIMIVITTLITGFRAYHRTKGGEMKMIPLALTLSLITYYLHAFLNNFLDTDKASAPFWGFTAILVAYDVYHTKKKEEQIKE